MILIWFNPKLEIFYTKYYKHYMETKFYLGYKNSYDHEVVQIFIFDENNKLYSVVDYLDYYTRFRSQQKKKRLLNRFIDLINKRR